MKSDSKQRLISRTEDSENSSSDAFPGKERRQSERSTFLFQRGIPEMLVLIILAVLIFPACSTRYATPSPEEHPEIILDEPPKDIPQIGGRVDDKVDSSIDGSIGGKISDEPVREQPRPRTSSPVVASLTHSAKGQMKSGQLDRAFSTVERALRIDSSNPNLWNLMARIQLKRGNIQQAEQLARKSNLLSRGNRDLQADNWRIIAESLKRRGATEAAKNAEMRANELK